MRIYHIGYAVHGKTLEIQARRCVDFLDCEIYDYMGQRQVTKKFLTAHRYQALEHAKRMRPDVYGKLRYAIVS